MAGGPARRSVTALHVGRPVPAGGPAAATLPLPMSPRALPLWTTPQSCTCRLGRF